MNKLDDDLVKKIQSYPEEMTNTDVWRELGVCRQTVARYRKWVAEALEEKKEKKSWLSKEEKKKLELLQHYSEKEVQEMLKYVAKSVWKSILYR